MRVSLLGGARIDGTGAVAEERSLGGRQARLTFARLVLDRHEAVPRDQLADMLWPERVPATWEPALRLVVSKVRTFLAAAGLPPAETLTSAFGCYRLHLPAHATVDVEEAALALEDAERALAEGRPADAVVAAAAASDVLARPLLPGEEGAWLDETRRRLGRQLVRALDVLANASVLTGDTTPGLAAAEQVVDLEPLREAGWALLMRVQAAGGNRAVALRTYERCRRLLAEELGVDPSAETSALYAELLGPETSGAEPAIVTTRTDEPGPTSAATPFVGRVGELGQLRAAWSQASAGTRGVLVLVGEAGIGKTRLATELAAGLDATAVVLHGRCDENAGIAYQPFLEGIARHAASCPQDRLRRHVGWAAPELSRLIPEVPGWLGDAVPDRLGPDIERHRLFAALTSYVGSVAATAPVLFILDDLQWATRSTLLLLAHLVRTLERAPLLVVATLREGERGPDTKHALTRLRHEAGATVLRLGGLDTDDLGRYVTEVAGLPDGPDREAWARTLRDQTGGNPLFAQEVVRHVLESGAAPDGAAVAGVVPDDVRDVIDQRCSRLSPSAQAAIDVAAVVGSEFDVDIVAAVSGLDDDDLLNGLDEAVEAGLAVERSATVYCFAHALVRDARYQGLGAARRARVHGRVGAALERRAETRPDAHAYAELAHHFASAATGESRDRAARYAVLAAEHAMAQLAYDEAAAHYEQAVTLLPAGRAHLPVLLALGDARRAAGALDQARAACIAAAAIAREVDDAVALAHAASGAGPGDTSTIAFDDTARTELLEEALDRLPPDDSEVRVRLLAELVVAASSLTDPAGRAALAAEADAMARRIGTPEVVVAAFLATRETLAGPAHTEARLAHDQEVIRLADRQRDVAEGLRARLYRINDLYEVGEPAAASAEIDAALAIATRAQLPYFVGRVGTWVSLRALVAGRFEESERLAADALARWKGNAPADAEHCCAMQLATMRLLQGRAHEWTAAFEVYVETMPSIPAWRCGLARLLADAGDVDHARREYDRFATDDFVEIPPGVVWLMATVNLAETCVLLGGAAGGAAGGGYLYERLAPFVDRAIVLEIMGGGAVYHGSVALTLGRLAVVLGRPVDARRHLETAVATNTRMGAMPWLARAQAELAAVLAATDPDVERDRISTLQAAASSTAAEVGIRLPIAAAPG